MMTNLFSSFDLSTGLFSMNWCSSILSLILLTLMYFDLFLIVILWW